MTEQQRHAITGRCMDAYAMQSLLALCLALRHAAGDILPALGDVSAMAVPPAGSPPCLPVQSDAPPVDALPQVPVETPWRIMMRWGWRPGQGLGPTASGPSELTLPLFVSSASAVPGVPCIWVAATGKSCVCVSGGSCM